MGVRAVILLSVNTYVHVLEAATDIVTNKTDISYLTRLIFHS